MTKIGQLEPELDKFLVEGLKLLKIEIDKLAHQILAAKSDDKKHGKTRELKNIRINVVGVKGFGTAKILHGKRITVKFIGRWLLPI